jgi:hypothetical protein
MLERCHLGSLDWVALAGNMIAAVGIWVAVLAYRRQVQISVFLEYTARFDQVMKRFPQEVRLRGLTTCEELPERSDVLTEAVLGYLNLVSGEFHLRDGRFLTKKVWDVWEPDIQRALQAPLITREWPHVSSHFEAHGPFKSWVDRQVGAAGSKDMTGGSA